MLSIGVGAAGAQQPVPDSTQADSTVVRLAPIEVVGSILTAAAGPRARSGIPARAVSLSAASLQSWRTRLLGDALTGRPAASLYDDLGSPFKQTLVMRGFAASPVVGLPQGVTVLVDGIPINEPGAGEVSFDLLPLEFAERVEVLSGTASLLGPNSLGGAVNLVTRRGGGDGDGFVEVEAGSFGSRGATIGWGGGAGPYDLFVGGGHESEDGWRARMSGERSHLFASGARLGTDRGVRLVAFGARSHAETAGSLPLSLYRLDPDSNLTAGDFEHLRQLNLSAAGYLNLLGGRASARLFGRIGDAERFNVNQQADPDVRGFTDSRTAGVDLDWTGARDWRGYDLNLRAGGGGMLNRTGIELYTERIDPGLTTHVESPIARADAYALAGFAASRLSVSAGARLDAVRVPFRNRLNPARDTTSTFIAFSPRAGATLRLGAGADLYASIGRSFRPPALIEIACADPEEPCPLPFALGDDPPIDPVRVTTWEAGLSWARGHVQADLSAYRSDVYDDIFLFPYEEEDEPEGSTIDGYFDNVPHTRRSGIEASAHAALPAGHRGYVSYAFSRATFRTGGVEIFSIREAAGAENEVEVGSRFPLVPDHTLSAGTDIVVRPGLELGAAAKYVGQRFLRGDESNDEPPLDGYATLDVRAGLQVRRWQLDAVLRNATDAEYFAFGTFNIDQSAGGSVERFVTPGRPRSLEVALRRDFR